MNDVKEETGLEIAVIGMAGRLPGARNISEFWENLENGVESIAFFSDEELQKNGVGAAALEHPGYVRAKGVLEEIEYFDPAFFNFTPGEAELMDPQLRVFLECAWHALEDGGYDPGSHDGAIGLYAGNAINHYWIAKTMFNKKYYLFGQFKADLLNTHFSTQVSYHLNLKGPGLTIQTACSTSLVTIHQACLALLSSECDMALAGGVSLSLPQQSGFIFQEGMVGSPDGHCRPFDARGKGTISGSGAGVVLLKRLEDAQEDGDHIYALIKGSAINNDGVRKVGYTAPSVEGQAEAIRAAYVMAEVEPAEVSYIETHGTATELGDPVEMEALSMVFHDAPPQSIAIGSVKSNLGHLDSASGVTGFIKTALSLHHRRIPASLHFETPNPKIGFKGGPFYVNTGLQEWQSQNGGPLRAGVSSFGLGGTNAHVVLEEYRDKAAAEPSPPMREHMLMLLSGHTAAGLERQTENLSGYLEQLEDPLFPDAAYTLQTGRKPLPYRRMLLCSNREEALDLLKDKGRKVKTFHTRTVNPPVVFLFSGQGAQYAEMGMDLYRKEKDFRLEMDRCFDILKSLVDMDLKEVLYINPPEDEEELGELLNRTEITQPVVFAFEYALAKLLMKWGIRPAAMTGYSMGEYLAACISGVFSLEDALKLVVARGKLMQQTPAASMLSVPLPEEQVSELLVPGDGVTIAIRNGPTTIVTGETAAIDTFEEQMKQKRLLCAPVNMGHAVHSPLMESIRGAFEGEVAAFTLNAPQIPYVSNVTADWISAEEAADPGYYGRHMCGTVRFSESIDRLLTMENAVFVEIGPGRLLSNILRQHAQESGQPARHRVVNVVKHQQEKAPDDYYLAAKLGELWLYGVNIDWQAFYGEEKRRKLSLPLYEFEKKRFWIDEDPFKQLMEKISGAPAPETAVEEAPEQDTPDEVEVEEEFYYGFDEAHYEVPRDELEQAVAQLWQDFLGFERIGIQDNFFEINGDSLTATQLISRLQQVYPVEISLQDFFEEPTIAHLSERIRELLVEKVKSLSEEELDSLQENTP
jgi:acyl transferase domain-containing protein